MRGKFNVDLCSRSLNYISICTGGGGLDLGVELAMPGARAVCLVEREAFAVAHLVAAMQASFMAPAPVWSDVGTFAGRPWRGLVDGLIGGIPCQPHSLAGKRLGEDDERDLWSDARRIIVQCGAWFVLIENVEGMLSSGGAERVVRDLRRLGFEVEVGLFSASETGASHQRNRVFILAVADGPRLGFRRWSGPQSIGAPEYRRAVAVDHGEALADSVGEGREGSQRPGASAERYGPTASGSIAELRGVSLVNTSIERRGKRRSEPEFRGGRNTASGTGVAMDGASCLGRRPVSVQQGQQGRSGSDASGAGASLVDAVGSRYDGRPDDAIGGSIGGAITEGASGDGVPSLFPPGPSDLDGWRRVLEDSPHLEPAVRRMADGVAARMDLSGPHAARIERLRMLGNGVVPLQAAYAIRTLGSRLAANGSAGAAFLVQLMKIKN